MRLYAASASCTTSKQKLVDSIGTKSVVLMLVDTISG